MKKLLISVLFCLLVSCGNLRAASRLDPSLMPITTKELNRELNKHRHDATQVTILLRRAGESELIAEAVEAMNRLYVKEPKNPVALAGFCMAYDVEYWKSTVAVERSAQSKTEYNRCLKLAYALAPRLWMTYMVEGYNLVFNNKTYFNSKEREKGFTLLRKAVWLAPQNSYSQLALGRAYLLQSVRTPKSKRPNSWKAQWMRKAVYHFEKALQLQPPLFHAAFELFEIAHHVERDRKRAMELGKAMVAMMPKGKKVSRKVHDELIQYGIKVDAYS